MHFYHFIVMVLFIDCQVAGISGDMILSSLVDLGANKSKIIDGVKEKVMDAVMPSIGGGIMESIPDMTGPAMPTMPKL